MGQRRLAGGLLAVALGTASFLAAPVAMPAAGATASRASAPARPRTRVSGPAWAVTTIPNITNYNSPLSISCGSATSCKAVGGSVNVSGVERTLIQSWNGSAWSTSASPNVGVNSNTLSAVSCVSATFCQAVGYYTNSANTLQTLTEVWNGSYWSLPSPLSPNNGTSTNVLSGVSCASTTSCEAVGYYVNSTTSAIQTLIESWNGTSWSLSSSPNSGTGSNSLSAVSCVSTTACQAVGESTSGTGAGQTLIESLNGTTWTVATTPTPPSGSTSNVLQGVACASASSCQAVGYSVNARGVIESLVEALNGSSWTVKFANNSTSSNALYDVACPTVTSCQAVGYSVNASSTIQTLAETWNGTSWSSPTTQNNGSSTNALYGVACLSTTSCLAAGSYLNSTTNVVQTLVEAWNGTAWTIKTTPGGVLNDGLNAVSCESTGFCEAVGSYKSGSGAQQTLIESWYGGNWAIIPSPDIGSRSNILNGVSCVSINFCQAVGSYLTSSGLQQTLVESWNGTVWTTTPSPNHGTGVINSLSAVSCVSSSFCVAVGYSATSGVQQTLAETWNGTAWSIVATPTSATGNSVLAGVSCVSTTLCQAVGSTVTSGTVSKTLVETFNGSTWTTATSPSSGALSNVLNGVACVSATSCRAVGSFLKTSTLKQTLVLSWNGTTWSLASSPNAGAGSNELRGLTCVSTSFCQAVGDSTNTKNVQQALIETWNGTAWVLPTMPNAGAGPSTLGGVACLSVTSCKAAGQDVVSSISQALIESFG